MPRKEARDAAQMIARECLGLRIRRLDRSLSRIYDGALRPHGLTIAQLGLLTAVTLGGPIQPSKLGDILDLERSPLPGWEDGGGTQRGVAPRRAVEVRRLGYLQPADLRVVKTFTSEISFSTCFF